MRALLLLSLVGIALYALLVFTSNVVPDSKVQDTFAGKTQPNHPIDRELRSWGSNLPALANSSQRFPPHPQHGAHAPTEQMSGGNQPAASPGNLAALELDSSKQDHVEWTKVMLAARVHSEASVSSPTIRFYRPGTELQVVSRENGWLQLLDPVTQERGWVFEKYLVSIDRPSPTQAAMESITEPLPTKVASPKSQKPSLSAKLTVRAGDVQVAKSDRRRGRWARRDDRRRNLGLFGFFRGREVGPAAWSIGSAR
jgi:Bacterial SH3 domain